MSDKPQTPFAAVPESQSSPEGPSRLAIPRILIQTVGTGGEKNPVWEALAFAVGRLQPQLLVQFCSQKTAEETIPKFLPLVGDWTGERRQEICQDHDDVFQLIREYGESVERMQQEFPNGEFHVDFTSGTKPMSAAVMAVAISKKIPYVHYAVGKRDASGRVVQTEQLTELNTGPLVAENQLNELGRLFNRHQFPAVQEQAGSLVTLLTDPLLKARATTLASLAEAYGAWDRFDWKAAAHLLRSIPDRERKTGEFTRAGWNLRELHEQHRHVRNCKKGAPTPEREADLLANIDRRLGDGMPDDAVSRLYRLTELLLQERFAVLVMKGQGNRNNPTSKVPVEILDREVPDIARDLRNRKGEAATTWDLGLRDAMQVLNAVGDPVSQEMWKDYNGEAGVQDPRPKGDFSNLLEKRNNSWLAHGTTSVGLPDANRLRDAVANYLHRHFQIPAVGGQGPASLDDYLARARFSRCPWA